MASGESHKVAVTHNWSIPWDDYPEDQTQGEESTPYGLICTGCFVWHPPLLGSKTRATCHTCHLCCSGFTWRKYSIGLEFYEARYPDRLDSKVYRLLYDLRHVGTDSIQNRINKLNKEVAKI